MTNVAQPFRAAVAGALITAAVSTLGDYLWANVLPHGRPIYWFAHAIVLFLTVGFFLGWPSGKPLSGALGAAAARSALAAIGSGLGFYAISGIWMPFHPHGWDYARHFIYWTIAYLPGFAALLIRN